MKNVVIPAVLLVVALVSVVVYFSSKTIDESVVEETPTTVGESPTTSSSPKLTSTKVPLPTGTGKTVVTGAEASCKLQGEIKFLNSNTYDNQDALFIYSGIDDPARNILWTVSPQDDIRVGPNIFARLPVPSGESLLGVFLPESPKYKRYELTAKVQYGRLVDGNTKVFEKQCDGKTVVVLP